MESTTWREINSNRRHTVFRLSLTIKNYLSRVTAVHSPSQISSPVSSLTGHCEAVVLRTCSLRYLTFDIYLRHCPLIHCPEHSARSTFSSLRIVLPLRRPPFSTGLPSAFPQFNDPFVPPRCYTQRESLTDFMKGEWTCHFLDCGAQNSHLCSVLLPVPSKRGWHASLHLQGWLCDTESWHSPLRGRSPPMAFRGSRSSSSTAKERVEGPANRLC